MMRVLAYLASGLLDGAARLDARFMEYLRKRRVRPATCAMHANVLTAPDR